MQINKVKKDRHLAPDFLKKELFSPSIFYFGILPVARYVPHSVASPINNRSHNLYNFSFLVVRDFYSYMYTLQNNLDSASYKTMYVM